MFKSLMNALKVKEIRLKLLFTLAMLAVIRFGTTIPVPGIDVQRFKSWFEGLKSGNDAFGFVDRFTGGSFEKMSIFALSVTPYITSSIIIQLLTIAIPALEEMQKDGADGRKKMTAITRVVSVALAIIESIGLSVGFGRSGLLYHYNFLSVAVIVITLKYL